MIRSITLLLCIVLSGCGRPDYSDTPEIPCANSTTQACQEYMDELRNTQEGSE